jgi:hypothetical protein
MKSSVNIIIIITSKADRAAWVNTILEMLELIPLENTLIGSEALGGMSFEQV